MIHKFCFLNISSHDKEEAILFLFHNCSVSTRSTIFCDELPAESSLFHRVWETRKTWNVFYLLSWVDCLEFEWKVFVVGFAFWGSGLFWWKQGWSRGLKGQRWSKCYCLAPEPQYFAKGFTWSIYILVFCSTFHNSFQWERKEIPVISSLPALPCWPKVINTLEIMSCLLGRDIKDKR